MDMDTAPPTQVTAAPIHTATAPALPLRPVRPAPREARCAAAGARADAAPEEEEEVVEDLTSANTPPMCPSPPCYVLSCPFLFPSLIVNGIMLRLFHPDSTRIHVFGLIFLSAVKYFS